MVDLRGVGKTVLLNRVCRDAEGRGFVTVLLEAPEDRSLPGLICAPLHGALLKMSRLAVAGDAAKRALRALGGFVGAMTGRFRRRDVQPWISKGTPVLQTVGTSTAI